MDDVYEFENSEYRLASMQIKAIAYDVMTGITRKKSTLKSKAVTSEVLNSLTLISDRIVELTDSLEEELQKLDRITEKSQPENPSEKQENMEIKPEKDTEQVPSQPKEEKQPEIKLNNIKLPTTEVNEKQEPTMTVTTQTEENNTVTMSEPKLEINNIPEKPSSEVQQAPKVEESVPPSNSTPPEKTESEIPQVPEIKKIEKDDSSTATTTQEKQQQPAKKRLQKTTKNLSKAIMVRPNQLKNLRKSRKYQEQLVAKQGVFEMVEQAEEINPITQAPKQLPDEVERQIEDLTVKANIYYNEGEADKAQELYDKIRKLNEQYR